MPTHQFPVNLQCNDCTERMTGGTCVGFVSVPWKEERSRPRAVPASWAGYSAGTMGLGLVPWREVLAGRLGKGCEEHTAASPKGLQPAKSQITEHQNRGGGAGQQVTSGGTRRRDGGTWVTRALVKQQTITPSQDVYTPCLQTTPRHMKSITCTDQRKVSHEHANRCRNSI